jgi:hypothetical protein
MTPGDPRFPLKIARLREARSAIAAMVARTPRLEPDPEFEEWENSVETLLTEMFGPGWLPTTVPRTVYTTDQLRDGRRKSVVRGAKQRMANGVEASREDPRRGHRGGRVALGSDFGQQANGVSIAPAQQQGVRCAWTR